MREKAVIIVFCAAIGGLFLFNCLTPDKALSYSERRTLAQAPEWSLEFFMSGEAQTKIETWMLDQFSFRDGFRRLKAAVDLKLFRRKDHNGIYFAGDQVYKLDYPLKEQSVRNLAKKMEDIYDLYLKDRAAVVAVIPDKGMYAAEEKGYPGYDYYEMTGLLNSELDAKRFVFLDLMDALDPDSYFRTDLHWRQEGLGVVLERIGDSLGVDFPAASLGKEREDWEAAGYEARGYSPFYGAYYGQAALNIEPDTLTYFTSGAMENFQVHNMDERAGSEDQVLYNTGKLGGVDSYEVFLSGNSPLITIDNLASDSDRELIVFRDSFGSSIAPFLAEGYGRVTLIDLRFVGYQNIGRFVEFCDQDVLFLFSTGVVNNSDMIRSH